MITINDAQKRQSGVECVIQVRGLDDWKSALSVPLKLDEDWSKICGAEEVPRIDYTRKCAEINGDSFERHVVTSFFCLGYELEELEVEFSSKEEGSWGLCTWYKKHPVYLNPPDWAKRTFKNLNERNASICCAMWRTEHAGDREFCMLSLQMFGMALLGVNTDILLHKTILYRKVVFSPPKLKQQVAA